MSENIQLNIEGPEAHLIFDKPESSANVFGQAVMKELDGHLETIEKNSEIKRVLIRSAKKSIFIAGADINLIQDLKTEQEAEEAIRLGQQVFERVAHLKPLTVACIHGACMGGGLELTLACDIRVASNSSKTKLALPEVQLGILPGWGGTTRTPKLLTLDKALDLLLSGRTLDGKKALKFGLVDTCCPEEKLLEIARTIKKPKRKKPLMGKLMNLWPLRGIVMDKAYEGVIKKTRGLYPAPLEILSMVRRNPNHRAGLELELKSFAKLAVSPECKSLVNLFLTKEAADKDTTWKDKAGVENLPKSNCLSVLGAGVMGGGIAHLAAKRNFDIYMRDINNQGLQAGIEAAHQLVASEVKRRRITQWQGRKRLAKILPVTKLDGFEKVDTVIEAVVENIDIKKKALAEIEGLVKKDALIATNTSSISVTEIATALKHPENFVGIHFFNPVHRMPLIEIIRGKQTSDLTVARAVALTQALGKTPVVVEDGPGFLVNRLLAPYMNEALRLVDEGVHPGHIDEALLDYGMPMGPVRLVDEVGIDVANKVGHILSDGLGPRMAGPSFIEKLVEENQLGKKTGKGFYNYSSKNPQVVDRYASLVRKGSAQDIQMRVLLPMFNEACRCLAEGIIENSKQLDLAMILGTGYAPFRGGPIASCEALGWKKVEEALKAHTEKYGERFEPCEYLSSLAEK